MENQGQQEAIQPQAPEQPVQPSAEPVTAPTNPPTNPKRTFSKKILILGALILVVVIGIVLYFSRGLLLTSKTQSLTSNSVPTPTQTNDYSILTASEAASWKTFTSKDGDFNFRYPQDWSTRDLNTNETKLNENSTNVYLSKTLPNGDYICLNVVVSTKSISKSFEKGSTILKLGDIDLYQEEAGKSPSLYLTKQQSINIKLPNNKYLLSAATFNCISTDIDKIKLNYEQLTQTTEYQEAQKIYSTFKFSK